MNSLKDQIAEARISYSEGNADEALMALEQIQDQANPEVLFLRGEIYYKLQRWGEALNCFLHYREIDPDNSGAETYINMINSILAFYHTDLYNP